MWCDEHFKRISYDKTDVCANEINMRFADHIACIWKMKHEYRNLIGRREGTDQTWHSGVMGDYY